MLVSADERGCSRTNAQVPFSGETMAKVWYSMACNGRRTEKNFSGQRLRRALILWCEHLQRSVWQRCSKRAHQLKQRNWLNKVVEDCQDASAPPSTKPFIRLAQSELFEMQHLSIGKVCTGNQGRRRARQSGFLRGIYRQDSSVDFFGTGEGPAGPCTHTSGSLVQKFSK